MNASSFEESKHWAFSFILRLRRFNPNKIIINSDVSLSCVMCVCSTHVWDVLNSPKHQSFCRSSSFCMSATGWFTSYGGSGMTRTTWPFPTWPLLGTSLAPPFWRSPSTCSTWLETRMLTLGTRLEVLGGCNFVWGFRYP